MAVAGLDNLAAIRITQVIEELQDSREQEPTRLRWLSRTPRVNAEEGEMFARFVGRVLIADLRADDGAAGVYNSGKVSFETNQNANIKIGRSFNESQLRQFYSLINGNKMPSASRMVDFFGPTVKNCLLGIQHRIETLLVALHRDRLDYDRLGIKASAVSWGMPSDLKVTTAIPWTTAASATPVEDILTIIELGRIRYGVEFDRVTMSTQAFKYAIATTEFQNKAKALIPAQLTFTNLSLRNSGYMKGMFEQLLSVTGDGGNGTNSKPGGEAVTIELADERYWYQNPDGTEYSTRYMPINEVIIDTTMNDGDPSAKDIAVGEVIESMMLGSTPSVIGGGTLPGPRRGPIGFSTLSSSNLNPPGIVIWGADRAFPRRNRRQMNAVMTVGDFADTIAVGEPF